MKRTEERLHAYIELIGYVRERELFAGRQFGPSIVSDVAPRKNPKGKKSRAPLIGDDLATRLTIFGSSAINLLLICWELDYIHDLQARALKELFACLPLDEKNMFVDSGEECDLEQAAAIANTRVCWFAKKLVRQVQVELEGLPPWHRVRKPVRQLMRERRETKRRGLDADFMERTLEAIGARITAVEDEV